MSSKIKIAPIKSGDRVTALNKTTGKEEPGTVVRVRDRSPASPYHDSGPPVDPALCEERSSEVVVAFDSGGQTTTTSNSNSLHSIDEE